MGEYRVYFVDRSDGIVGAQWLAANSDTEALEEAGPLQRYFRREVWQNHREVGRLAPAGPQ